MSVGFGQILLILVAVLLLFGAGRVPRLMEDLAKGLRAFRKGMQDEEETPVVLPQSTPTEHKTPRSHEHHV